MMVIVRMVYFAQTVSAVNGKINIFAVMVVVAQFVS